MKLFFDNIDSLDQFTHQLDRYNGSLSCQHCSKQNQFVPHGFVYKNQHIKYADKKEPVGKRLLCSNRYGRSGCGRTLRLYLADYIPSLTRSSTQVTLFFLWLLSGSPIQAAYQKSAHATDPRNAYRWLTKCQAKLTTFRTFLSTRSFEFTDSFSKRTNRLQHLLPTVKRLHEKFGDSFAIRFQLERQVSFI
ncbi:MAG: hypothetical protein COB30_002545 [Ectothiorhodospiraceae bacterium]|nr:hypothetical protein [Ectothiorhodospiraceae bacterium]MBL4864915.1 hypothetical protein [Pseudomonadales bacterium]MBL4866540.1 hypothetical protein [Pseudomonadales bacterium]MBL4868334.1 hypothetical protein [Pseudomonadales bacterium]